MQRELEMRRSIDERRARQEDEEEERGGILVRDDKNPLKNRSPTRSSKRNSSDGGRGNHTPR